MLYFKMSYEVLLNPLKSLPQTRYESALLHINFWITLTLVSLWLAKVDASKPSGLIFLRRLVKKWKVFLIECSKH